MKSIKKTVFIILIFLFSGFLYSQNALKDSLNQYPVNMTVAEFNKRISNQNKLVLVAFSADWCVMCKKQKPILDEIKSEKKGVLEFIDIDMEENPLIAEHFNVDGLPINLIYKKGNLVWDRVGFKTKSELLKQISIFE